MVLEDTQNPYEEPKIITHKTDPNSNLIKSIYYVNSINMDHQNDHILYKTDIFALSGGDSSPSGSWPDSFWPRMVRGALGALAFPSMATRRFDGDGGPWTSASQTWRETQERTWRNYTVLELKSWAAYAKASYSYFLLHLTTLSIFFLLRELKSQQLCWMWTNDKSLAEKWPQPGHSRLTAIHQNRRKLPSFEGCKVPALRRLESPALALQFLLPGTTVLRCVAKKSPCLQYKLYKPGGLDYIYNRRRKIGIKQRK